MHPSRRAEIGGAWIRSDASEATQGLGFRPDELYTKSRDFYAGIEEQGAEVVDGVETTKYTGKQDLSAFFPKGSNNPAAAVLKDVRTVPYELYIDEDDLLRRMVIDITAQGATIKTIMDFFD